MQYFDILDRSKIKVKLFDENTASEETCVHCNFNMEIDCIEIACANCCGALHYACAYANVRKQYVTDEDLELYLCSEDCCVQYLKSKKRS